MYFNSIDTNTLKAANLVTDLTNQIKTLIKTPYFSKVGCSSGEEFGALLDAQKRVSLLPNQPLRVALFSFSNLTVSGFTSWSNTTEILSDYHIAGVVRNSLNNQMYSQRYGTIPIVRVTGGLDDTVIDLTEDEKKADGIKFREYSVRALAKAMRKALVLQQTPNLMSQLQVNAMRADFSWGRTSRYYESIFKKTTLHV